MEPAEMAQLVVESERAWQALGQISYGATQAEAKSRIFRRSLYVTQDLAPGDMLTPDNLRCIRPGLGLPPKYYDVLLGQRVGRSVKAGTPMSWGLLI
jgi:N-acetylneuraminate synthase